MKRCTVLRGCNFKPACYGRQTQRWTSYDSDSLSIETLLAKIEGGLNQGNNGRRININLETKTIATGAGDLPISPLFDPEWIRSRRREKKDDAGPPSGRFRRKLANNPYARALSTPIRRCPNTMAWVPRYFLQDLELVKHPQTGGAWWAPGPLAFEFVEPTKRSEESSTTEKNATGTATADLETLDTTTEQSQRAATKRGPSDISSTNEHATLTTGTEIQKPRPRRSPITSYILSRKPILDTLGGRNQKHAALLLATRSGMAISPEMRNTVWRSDMGDVILEMLRRQAVDVLITRSNRTQEPKDKFVQPCADWASVKDVKLRGCVLWLPKGKDAGGRYATLDIEGVQYGQKMAVHNLNWLLGEGEVKRLKDSSEAFRDNEILVLRQWNSISMMRLHLLLWRLQGYLAEDVP